MEGTSSGLCQVVDFGINSLEPLHSTIESCLISFLVTAVTVSTYNSCCLLLILILVAVDVMCVIWTFMRALLPFHLYDVRGRGNHGNAYCFEFEQRILFLNVIQTQEAMRMEINYRSLSHFT